jgi:hypothetical protein
MILNQASDGYLPIALMFRRTLIEYGPLPEQRLIDLCAPAIHNKAGNWVVHDDVAHTLTRWTQLGVFVRSTPDGTIDLAADFAKAPPSEDDSVRLRRAVRNRVLAEECNANFMIFKSDRESAGVCADFTRALTFGLAQDPGITFGNFERLEDLQNEHFRATEGSVAFRALQNDARWPGLRVWSRYLGFAWCAPDDALVFDPREAVADVLPEVFGGREELRIGAFLEALADRIPVLDGGRYRALMEEELRRGERWRIPLAREISGSLSRALDRLEIANRIMLIRGADSPDTRLLTGRNGRALREVTHVRRTLP